MDEKRLSILENLVKTLQDGVTQSEFLSAFERVTKFVQNFQEQIATTLETMVSRLNELQARVEAKLASVRDGRDGKDGAPGKDGRNGLDGQDGAPGRDGRDGQDGSPDTPDQIVDKINQAEVLINKEQINGLTDFEKKIAEQGTGGVRAIWGRSGIQLIVDGRKKGLVNYINFVPGSGIAITHNTRQGRNDITISATGSASLSPIAVTGTIDDSNTSFTAASAPNLVIVNGAAYRSGKGATISGTAITLDNPVGTGGDIYAL